MGDNSNKVRNKRRDNYNGYQTNAKEGETTVNNQTPKNEQHRRPRQNHEEIENFNRPITSKEIESVAKNLLTNESSTPDGFTGKFYQTLKEELIPILLKIFKK